MLLKCRTITVGSRWRPYCASDSGPLIRSPARSSAPSGVKHCAKASSALESPNQKAAATSCWHSLRIRHSSPGESLGAGVPATSERVRVILPGLLEHQTIGLLTPLPSFADDCDDRSRLFNANETSTFFGKPNARVMHLPASGFTPQLVHPFGTLREPTAAT